MADAFFQNEVGLRRPRVCLTAAGFLVHKNKVLLVKHKKLGFWLAPGGHTDLQEHTHEAAEREFWEETGITVKAVDAFSKDSYLPSHETLCFPRPFAVNLHWISKENYQQRQQSGNLENPVANNKKWKLGCEQHICYVYLVKPVNGVQYRQNIEETDGIAWFSEEDLEDLETIEDIKEEAKFILAHVKKNFGGSNE